VREKRNGLLYCCEEQKLNRRNRRMNRRRLIDKECRKIILARRGVAKREPLNKN